LADAVTSQKIVDGQKNVVYALTNLSDGTGESAVLKVDVSGLSAGPRGAVCAGVRILRVHYSVFGMNVSLLWDADTDVKALVLQGDGCLDFTEFGGIPNNAGAGKTGDLLLTTAGHSSNDTYSIVLELGKVYA